MDIQLTPQQQRLTEMTAREIAYEANIILAQYTPAEAKKKLEDHIAIINAKMKAWAAKTNKELGTHRSAPQIRTLSDFKRFR